MHGSEHNDCGPQTIEEWRIKHRILLSSCAFLKQAHVSCTKAKRTNSNVMIVHAYNQRSIACSAASCSKKKGKKFRTYKCKNSKCKLMLHATCTDFIGHPQKCIRKPTIMFDALFCSIGCVIEKAKAFQFDEEVAFKLLFKVSPRDWIFLLNQHRQSLTTPNGKTYIIHRNT